MNNKHMEILEKNKTMKDLRGLADSLRKEEEDQPNLQQDQLTLLFMKQTQQFSSVHLIE